MVVAVEKAVSLIPPGYLVRLAGHKITWENNRDGERFQIRDRYGEPVAAHESDDLLYLRQAGNDVFEHATNKTGMSWPEIWQEMTGEEPVIRNISGVGVKRSVCGLLRTVQSRELLGRKGYSGIRNHF